MTESLDKKIEELEAKLKQTKALKQKKEALLKAANSKKERQNDTRRKILAGAMILAEIEKGEADKGVFLMKMDKLLTRPADRELFRLDDTNQEPQASPERRPRPQF